MSFNSTIKINGEFQYSLDVGKIKNRFSQACINEVIDNDIKQRELDIEEEKKRHIPIVRTERKVGRNDPCPCRSGKKFKKCCITK